MIDPPYAGSAPAALVQDQGATHTMELSSLTWLRADYDLPATYSCRVPMSSIASARALPSPGPATVRLALIRTGIEAFGIEYVQSILFPHICAMPIHIRPPERVALTSHVLRAYKVEEDTKMSEAPIFREMVHAQGLMTIYLQAPISLRDPFSQVLSMIGYWGQASSLAWCTGVQESFPPLDECVMPLRLLQGQTRLRPFFSSILSEFRDRSVAWDEVMPTVGVRISNALRLDVYVWPLTEVSQHGSGKLLVRQAFTQPEDAGGAGGEHTGKGANQ